LHNGSEEDEHREYELKNSFLLGSAAPVHVCNNRERFTNFTPADGKQKLLKTAFP
jgi:hypothetical protein